MQSQITEVRIRLKKLNTDAWNGDELPIKGKLDSSLKKNTAFVKKIKVSMSHEGLSSTLKDIHSLSLEKYLSEIITAISEGLVRVVKPEDIVATMEIISALHQRFCQTFSPLLLSIMLNMMARQQANPLPISRQKSMLRLLAEFNFIGIFRTISDLPSKDDLLPSYIIKNYSKFEKKDVSVIVLRDLLNDDILNGTTLPIATGFLKRFHNVIYPSSSDESSESHEEDQSMSAVTLVEGNTIAEIRHIFDLYATANLKALVHIHDKLSTLDSKIKKTSIRIGKIPEELTSEKAILDETFQNVKSACQYFVEIIQKTSDGSILTLPELNDSSSTHNEEDSIIEVVKSKTGEDETGVWDSIESKNFYTKLPDLNEKSNGQSTGVLNNASSDGERMREFIAKLETVSTMQEIDSLAEEFLTSKLNNKASKNRIFKYFLETQEIYKLKFFARFMAIHSKTLSELITELIEYVDRGFRTQIYNSNSRLNFKNIFFFCELIKFKLIPTHVIFHKIRALTLNITATNNLDILSVFYEQCGRFLLHEPEYKELMEEMVMLLKSKRKNEQFSSNDKLAINNLLVIVEPPAISAKPLSDFANSQEILSSYSKFIHHLLRIELSSARLPSIIKLLRKLDYLHDIEIQKTLLNSLSSPELINYDNIPNLAIVLSNLSSSPNTNWIHVYVIDSIIEKITRGLELTDYRLNRGQVACVRYISELYNIGFINWKLILNLLYRIINSGHPNNQPLPLNYNVETDMPDNYFRIQLCCVMLMNIDRPLGLPKKKLFKKKEVKKLRKEAENNLDQFMCYFEYYVFTKKQPIPIETEFKISDLFGKLSSKNRERAVSINEAIFNLQEIILKRQENGTKKEEIEAEEDDDELDQGEEDDEDLHRLIDDMEDEFDIDVDDDLELEEDDDTEIENDIEDEEFDTEDDDEEDDDDDEDDEDDDEDDDDDDEDEDEDEDEDDEDEEDEDELDSDLETPLSMEEQMFADELEKDFQKIVLDTYAYNKNQVGAGKSKFSVAVPSKKFLDAVTTTHHSDASKLNHTPFTLLSKKGKKTNATQVLLPDDSKLSLTKRRGDMDQQMHRERIMQLVRNME